MFFRTGHALISQYSFSSFNNLKFHTVRMPEPRFICNMYWRNISRTHNFDRKTKEETAYGRHEDNTVLNIRRNGV